MAEFLATIKSPKGAIKELRIEAESALAARRFLRRRGIKPLALEQSRGQNQRVPQQRQKDFIASYTDQEGSTKTTTVQAEDERSARRRLRRRGIKALSLERFVGKTTNHPAPLSKKQPSFLPTETGGDDAGGIRRSGFTGLEQLLEKAPGVKEKAVFASKLAALVDAGVPIVRSLDLMASQQKLPMFKRALTKVSLDVNEGIALGSAIREWPKVFDQLSIAMVEAGEAGGVLDEALKRLAKLLEDNAKLQNQIKGAMGYPVAVLVIAILVFLGMTIFLIPTFAGIFEDLGAELPAFTQLLVNFSELLRSTVALYIVGVLLLIIWLFARYYATHNGRRVIDRLILKLPLFGELILMTATAQFCRIFSSLSRAGVPILMSMEISSQTAGNSIISDAILASRGMVQEGVLFSTALIRQKVLPDMALNMLAIGEETGEMDKMLSKVADFYEDEVGAMVKALTSMLEPAMIVVVGGIVGSILLAMYLPMFTVFDQIQ